MKILLQDVKLTKSQHDHLEKMELKTLDELEAECRRQMDLIPDAAVCRAICSDCQESVWEAREFKEKLIKESK